MERAARVLPVAIAALLCAFAPLALGTVHLWPVTIASSLALVALGFTLHDVLSRSPPRFRIGWLGAALIAVTLWTAFQLVPLPPGVLKLLSPRAHEILEFTLKPFGGGEGAWRPLSLAPAATAQELVKLIGLTAIYLVGANLPGRSERNAVLGAIAVTGPVLVLIGLVQRLAGTHSLLGFYESRVAFGPHLTSTFVNPNHLASCLALSVPVAFALSLAQRARRSVRVLFACAGAVSLAGVILTLSRAGILATAIGLLLFLFFLLVRRRGSGGPNRVRQLGLIAAVLLVAILLGALVAFPRLRVEFSWEELVRELRDGNKVQVWKDSIPLLSDFVRAGIGKGAFASVFPMYQTTLAQYAFTHVENEVLQVVIDYGILLGGFLLLAVLGSIGRALLRPISEVRAGALAGVLTVCIHNGADFNLEVAGVAFPWVLALSAVIARFRENGADPPAPSSRMPWMIALVWTLAAAVGIPFAVSRAAGHGAGQSLARIRAAPSAVELERALGEEAQYHPADYLLFTVAAARAAGGPRPDVARAVRWINRALFLNGPSYQPHLVAARILLWAGRSSQAVTEFKLAAQRRPDLLSRLLDELATVPRSAQAFAGLSDGPEMLERVVEYLCSRNRMEEASRVLTLRLRLVPEDPTALRLFAELELMRKNFNGALALARRLSRHSGGGQADLLIGHAQRELGNLDEALTAYERARKADLRLAEAYVQIAGLHLAKGEAGSARARLQQLQSVDLRIAGEPRVSLLWGRVFELEGHKRRALSEYRRVLRALPNNAEALRRIQELERRGVD
jgi:tetratricopeptide (TPR) repeat protein